MSASTCGTQRRRCARGCGDRVVALATAERAHGVVERGGVVEPCARGVGARQRRHRVAERRGAGQERRVQLGPAPAVAVAERRLGRRRGARHGVDAEEHRGAAQREHGAGEALPLRRRRRGRRRRRRQRRRLLARFVEEALPERVAHFCTFQVQKEQSFDPRALRASLTFAR
jgi:hypothetical protein